MPFSCSGVVEGDVGQHCNLRTLAGPELLEGLLVAEGVLQWKADVSGMFHVFVDRLQSVQSPR